MNNQSDDQNILIPTDSKDKTINQRSSSNQDSEKSSFVKLAMRNMVKKGSTSLFHFFLTILGVIGTLLGLAIAFH
jgi:urate oxidase